MKYLTAAAGIAAALAAGAFTSIGVAVAAPTGPGNADETISRLEALGNQVIVDRLSDVPLSDASVVLVRPSVDTRQMAWVADAAPPGLAGQTVHVAVR